MQHGRDHLVQYVVVPDALPVVAQDQAVAESDGNFAGIRNLSLAKAAQEDQCEDVDVSRQERNRGFTLDAPSLGFSTVSATAYSVEAPRISTNVGSRKAMSRSPMTKQFVTGANICSLTFWALAKSSSPPWILAITRSWGAGFGRLLADEKGRMAGVGDDEAAVVAQGQFFGDGSGGVEDDQRNTRFHQGDDAHRDFLDDYVRHGRTTMSFAGMAAFAGTTENPRALIEATPASEFSQRRRSTRSGCLARLLETRVPIFPPRR